MKIFSLSVRTLLAFISLVSDRMSCLRVNNLFDWLSCYRSHAGLCLENWQHWIITNCFSCFMSSACVFSFTYLAWSVEMLFAGDCALRVDNPCTWGLVRGETSPLWQMSVISLQVAVIVRKLSLCSNTEMLNKQTVCFSVKPWRWRHEQFFFFGCFLE